MTSISSCGGSVGRLDNDYVDVITSDLGTFIARHNRWAELEAREILATSSAARPQHATVTAQLTGTAIERAVSAHARLPARSRCSCARSCSGSTATCCASASSTAPPGLVFHTLQRFWFRFLIDAKIWELRRPRSQMLESQPPHASQLRVNDSERQRRPGSSAPLAAPPPHGAAARPADPECDYS